MGVPFCLGVFCAHRRIGVADGTSRIQCFGLFENLDTAGCSLLVGALTVARGLPRSLALWVIFAAAAAQVYVIGRYYMRLRSEDVLIYTLALLPVALVIVMALVFIPDVAMHP